MPSGFLKTLFSGASTIDDCRADVLDMIHRAQEMYHFVLQALHDEQDEGVRARTKKMDQEVNRLQRQVRQKIYRHLALSRGQDLLSALQLHDIANEIERVGDYSKNIAELADMFPSGVHWGEHEQGMTRIHAEVLSMFDVTFRIVEHGEREDARRADEIYGEVASYCDDVLEKVVTDDEECVPRSALSLVLMARYNKRVAAHLKNTVQTIMNPYDRIGYRG